MLNAMFHYMKVWCWMWLSLFYFCPHVSCTDYQEPLFVKFYGQELFLSDIRGAFNASLIRLNGIGCVVQVATPQEIEQYALLDCTNQETDAGIRKHIVPILDNGMDKLSPFFLSAFNFIGDCLAEGEHVLIHCVEGKSRSSTLAIAYVMSREKLSLRKAYDLIKTANPRTSPRYQLFQELLDLELSLYGQATMTHPDNYEPIVVPS